jgi:GxxExxY protein
MEYKFSDITERIIKACMVVHSTLGNGFTHCRYLFFKGIRECIAFQEVIYQRALTIEFELLGINFQREFCMPIYYRAKHIDERRVDFLVEEKISVEIKALSQLENLHLAQAMNYLEAYNLEVGMLINFGANSLEWKRLFNKKYKPFS